MNISAFLLSYWWIFFIFIVILSFFVKSIRKILVFLLIALISFVIFWQLSIAKGFTQSTACLFTDAQLSSELKEKASKMSPGAERDKFICEEGKVILSKLEQCFIKSARDHSFSFMIYSSLPKAKNLIRESVTGHNLRCPDNQVSDFDFK